MELGGGEGRPPFIGSGVCRPKNAPAPGIRVAGAEVAYWSRLNVLPLAPVNSVREGVPDALFFFRRHPAPTVLLIEDEPIKKPRRAVAPGLRAGCCQKSVTGSSRNAIITQRDREVIDEIRSRSPRPQRNAGLRSPVRATPPASPDGAARRAPARHWPHHAPRNDWRSLICRTAPTWLLSWSQSQLAARARRSLPTVKRVERAFGLRASNETRAKLRRDVEAAAVKLIDENGGGAGVRFRKPLRFRKGRRGE